ncbi:2'-5' RNA ligase family protein [Microvirga solisilvae]|uniref:2'-5' RNA ligase family protein n=1 Tax=Microvirga solisilvae TaxID=2919498 RepID=UPI001FAF5D30|nr:2'-5' RNA ligase family protein [Microvirga solisilvae]
MLQTIADTIWGEPCLAYHVQPELSLETRASLGELQHAIAKSWPVPLYFAPAEALHITLYALINVKDRFDKEGYWSSIAEPCRALLDDLCTGHAPLELRFSGLKVTDTAIIATATDETGLIMRIRERIADLIPPPPGLKPMRYNLIHSTLARYRTSDAVPDDAVRAVQSIPVSITAPIERLKIVRETVFPCLAMDEIFSFPLR